MPQSLQETGPPERPQVGSLHYTIMPGSVVDTWISIYNGLHNNTENMTKLGTNQNLVLGN